MASKRYTDAVDRFVRVGDTLHMARLEAWQLVHLMAKELESELQNKGKVGEGVAQQASEGHAG
eukprot:6388691-Amphidinium_carterae.1